MRMGHYYEPHLGSIPKRSGKFVPLELTHLFFSMPDSNTYYSGEWRYGRDKHYISKSGHKARFEPGGEDTDIPSPPPNLDSIDKN